MTTRLGDTGMAGAMNARSDGRMDGLPGGDDEVGAALRAEVIARINAGKIELPLLPQVAGQVLTLAGQANADAAQLSGLIHRDPALAGQVLRIANSPGYMPRMPIVSLQQAVARLGLNTVTEIALVASMQSGTFKVPGYEAELKKLWRHALASGVFAKEIARVRRANVEAAFLCGLLHAVGKPALLQAVVDTAGPSRPTPRVVMAQLLEDWHTTVGLRIAEVWGLPRLVVTAMATYASYASTAAFTPEAAITCLADRLATDLTEPGRFDAQTLVDHSVFGDLNLYPDDIAGLLAQRAKVSQVVDSMTA